MIDGWDKDSSDNDIDRMMRLRHCSGSESELRVMKLMHIEPARLPG